MTNFFEMTKSISPQSHIISKENPDSTLDQFRTWGPNGFLFQHRSTLNIWGKGLLRNQCRDLTWKIVPKSLILGPKHIHSSYEMGPGIKRRIAENNFEN